MKYNIKHKNIQKPNTLQTKNITLFLKQILFTCSTKILVHGCSEQKGCQCRTFVMTSGKICFNSTLKRTKDNGNMPHYFQIFLHT
jgi:hypothetical protein